LNLSLRSKPLNAFLPSIRNLLYPRAARRASRACGLLTQLEFVASLQTAQRLSPIHPQSALPASRPAAQAGRAAYLPSFEFVASLQTAQDLSPIHPQSARLASRPPR